MIYFDLDGVLADFDKAAERALGTDNIYKFEYVYGADVFWQRIHAVSEDDFFRHMELMPGALAMLRATEHLPCTILTALPKTNTERADAAKRAWVRDNIGPMPVITCFTTDKPNYCKPGDVLIDDRALNRQRWLANGGRYIVHINAESTITQLEDIGVL